MQSVKLLIESIVELALLLAYHSRPQEMGLMQVIQVFRRLWRCPSGRRFQGHKEVVEKIGSALRLLSG